VSIVTLDANGNTKRSVPFANPSATIGGAAVNGVSNTAMRSDAAPALANTAVSAGSYKATNLTVDAQGRLTAAASASGSSNPAQPAYGNNVPFFRTDLGWWIYYDGTRWLTAFELPMIYGQIVLSNQDGVQGNFRTDHAPYITRVSLVTRVPTTNNGSNYWTVVTHGWNAAMNAASNIDSFTTAADTVNVETPHDHAPSVSATPANNLFGAFNATTTGSPGQLEIWFNILFRLIIT
jgi:hypothetical protein